MKAFNPATAVPDVIHIGLRFPYILDDDKKPIEFKHSFPARPEKEKVRGYYERAFGKSKEQRSEEALDGFVFDLWRELVVDAAPYDKEALSAAGGGDWKAGMFASEEGKKHIRAALTAYIDILTPQSFFGG